MLCECQIRLLLLLLYPTIINSKRIETIHWAEQTPLQTTHFIISCSNRFLLAKQKPNFFSGRKINLSPVLAFYHCNNPMVTNKTDVSTVIGLFKELFFEKSNNNIAINYSTDTFCKDIFVGIVFSMKHFFSQAGLKFENWR